MAAPFTAVTVFLAALVALSAASADFRSGTGIYDVTGPVTEVDFMGYAFPNQTGNGLHLRLFSRAFIFEDSNGNRVVYVSADICMAMYGMKVAVVERLKEEFPSGLYGHDNVLISGIHTHSGPGAFSWFLLYDISMLGFNKKHFEAVVDGLVESIKLAHNDLEAAQPQPIHFAQGLLANASRNRSPSSYLANPAEERAEYEKWGGDTDHNMTTIALPNGAISFFSVHCTSMHNSNRLVSGDNKGYASYLVEQELNNHSLPGSGSFVAAFGQSNEGDVSPNTLGAWCYGRVGGTYCGNNRSLCDGKNEHCVSVGPAGFEDDEGSAKIIGEKQAAAARKLLAAAKTDGEELSGTIDTAFKWVDMSSVTVSPEFTVTGQAETTCRPAVGFSFAAGTTDGPGAFDFYQGDNCSSCQPLWNFARNFIKKPTQQQIECQAPKPVLLDVGETKPHPWVPSVLPLQIQRIGSLVIVAVPGEFTTMAGRRLRKAVAAEFSKAGISVTVVIAGLSNAYTGYISTYEEYEWQRYEAASTLYGPHTLSAYIQEFSMLARAMANGQKVDPGHPAINQTYVNFDLQPGVLVDEHPSDKPFGTIEQDVKASYIIGDMVTLQVWGGNLRNDYMRGKTNTTYLTVEKSSGSEWEPIMTDANWETKVRWGKQGRKSLITLEWTIPAWAPEGTYRLVHRAAAKPSLFKSDLVNYSATSATFKVTAA
eukprot:m.13961 g.13961  ORF g.13961 m.13961 type:complete len:707 (-) comp4705_c0_seq1:85-2205(-)